MKLGDVGKMHYDEATTGDRAKGPQELHELYKQLEALFQLHLLGLLGIDGPAIDSIVRNNRSLRDLLVGIRDLLNRQTTAWTFYYDGDCGMCAATVRCLRRFDWRNRIEWKAMQDIASPPPGITREDLDRSAYLVCAPGENYEGFFGFRKMFMAMPLLFPLGALMWVPGVHLIGVSTYRLVADNRHRISRCGLPGWRVDGVDQRGD